MDLIETKINDISIYKKSIFNILEKIKHGRITIIDQDYYSFGDLRADITATIKVVDSVFYRRIFFGGGIALAETYMEQIWDIDNLTNLIRILTLNIELVDSIDNKYKTLLFNSIGFLQHLMNKNNKNGSRKNISKHYDLGNNFFSLFLDSKMMYSCADFTNTENLEDASENKLKNICKMLDLKSTDHILEIGTGWGGFAIYAAQNYGSKVTTTTISKQQYNFVIDLVAKHRLQDKIKVLLEDYRDLTGKYDKIVSIEMIEAVGHQYFSAYFSKCCGLLKENGLFVLQAITINEQRYISARDSIDFIKKHVFPGGCLPSITSIMQNITTDSDLRLQSLVNLTLSYAKTLRAWHKNFITNQEQIRAQGFDEYFMRKWLYYLCYCEAGFLENNIGLFQMTFAKPSYRSKNYYLYCDHNRELQKTSI